VIHVWGWNLSSPKMASQRSIPNLDRISALPDSVICHILSFLSTKQSAATSILSKIWNPLWLSVPSLDFDERNFTDFNTLRLFVYSVMLARDPTLPIRSFRLKSRGISSGFNPHDVDRFINAAMQRGIQNLNLDIGFFKLPTCVFSCINLTVLKLRALKIQDLPDVNFPLLKTLHLDSIFFPPSGAQCHRCLKRLLSGCPILEDLHATSLLLVGFPDEEFNGLHQLVRANIHSIPMAWVRNAKFLSTKLVWIPMAHHVKKKFGWFLLFFIFWYNNLVDF